MPVLNERSEGKNGIKGLAATETGTLGGAEEAVIGDEG